MGRVAGVAILGIATLAMPFPARAQDGPTGAMDGEWHFTVAPYMWFTGLSGDVSAGGVASVPIEASFADVWDNFDVGAQGHFEGRKDRFGFAVDFVWTNLGVPVEGASDLVDATVDVRQLITEGVGFYRAVNGGRENNPGHLDVLAGVRFMETRTRLSLATPSGPAYDGDFRTLSWVDALAGLRLRAPLGARFALLGRTDIAGFGSRLTWNLEGDLAFRAGERWTLGAGWRHLDIDYDDGEGRDRRAVDLAYDGPRAWFAYSW